MGIELGLDLVPGALGGGLSYPDLIAALNFTWYVRNKEAAGAGTVANSGSDGGSGTATNCTQGATGKLGAQEACSFNGDTSLVTFLNAAIPGTAALTTQRWAWLVKANTLGETNQGAFAFWNTTNGRILFRANNVLEFVVITDGTNMSAISNTNQVDFLGSWAWVFCDFDNAGTRKGRLFRGLNGAVTQLTLATDTAATGTVTAQSGSLVIGNRAAADLGFDGLIDEGGVGAGLWTTAEMLDLVIATGV